MIFPYLKRGGGGLPRDAKEKFEDGAWKFVAGSHFEASKCFSYAKKVFKSKKQKILADLSSAMQAYSSALEKVFIMDYSKAIMRLEKAKQKLEILRANNSTSVDFQKSDGVLLDWC